MKQLILTFAEKTSTSTHWLQYSIASIKNTIKSFEQKNLFRPIEINMYSLNECYFHIHCFIKRLNAVHVSLLCFQPNAIELISIPITVWRAMCSPQKAPTFFATNFRHRQQSHLTSEFYSTISISITKYIISNPSENAQLKATKKENYIIAGYLKHLCLLPNKAAVRQPPFIIHHGPNLPSCTQTVNNN